MNPSEIATLGLAAYLVVVALLLGSFIHMAAARLPRHESLVHPRSHCRSCGRVLNLVDLIPVAGYLVRGGRCASCRTAIGASSPAVEALCGAAMVASVALLGPWWGAVAGFVAVGAIGVAGVSLGFRASMRESRQG